MFVIKRKGHTESVNFDKIHTRIKFLVLEPYELKHVNATQLTRKVIQNIYDSISTSDIDN